MKLPEVIGVGAEAPASAIFKPDANRLNAKKDCHSYVSISSFFYSTARGALFISLVERGDI